MISAYECVFSSPLTLEALGKPNCFSVTKINNITGCVLSSVAFRKRLLGMVCFLSEVLRLQQQLGI